MLQVHDELLYEVPDELVSVFISKLRDIAESAELLDGFCGRLHVPLAVRITSGKSWSSLM
jgi:DNA polymerase I-like protein with 3'-5' exonuclease and polymerase domains